MEIQFANSGLSTTNITPMTKDPAWPLFFNGPGMGISREDGTLVFPAQYKDAERIPHSILFQEVGQQAGAKKGSKCRASPRIKIIPRFFGYSVGCALFSQRSERWKL